MERPPQARGIVKKKTKQAKQYSERLEKAPAHASRRAQQRWAEAKARLDSARRKAAAAGISKEVQLQLEVQAEEMFTAKQILASGWTAEWSDQFQIPYYWHVQKEQAAWKKTTEDPAKQLGL